MSGPHRSSLLTVKPEWIDHNGHLNMAYYNVLFDNAADEFFATFGIDETYIARTGFSTFSAEFHVCYLREVHEGNQVYVTSQLLDFDEKRFHFFQELYHADGWLSATGEGLGLHVELAGPKVAPMPAETTEKLTAIYEDHRQLPSPERAGRSIGIKRR